MDLFPRSIFTTLLVFSVLLCTSALADLSGSPSTGSPAGIAESGRSLRDQQFSADNNTPLLDLGYGIEYWKKGRPYLGFALADGPAGLPGGFEHLEFEPRSHQISSLLVLFVPLEECPRYPGGRFRLYAGVGPGVSLIEEDPFDGIGPYSMDIGVDVRFGFLWSF